jgi:predicted nucleic acid-binding protein
MNRCYFDTSAVAKLLLEERESEDVRRWVGHADVEPVSSLLLETELRRVAWHQGVAQDHVTAVLGHFELHEVPAWEWRAAGLIPGRVLRSLDALHVAAAIRIEADALISYDERMIEAATQLGLPVIRPGLDAEGTITRV